MVWVHDRAATAAAAVAGGRYGAFRLLPWDVVGKEFCIRSPLYYSRSIILAFRPPRITIYIIVMRRLLFIIYDFPEALGLSWFYDLGLPFVAWKQPLMINHFMFNIKTYSAQ